MSAFVDKCEDRVHGVLSCFDRMLFSGYLPIMSGWSMAQLLQVHEIDCGSVKPFLLTNAERVKAHALALACQHGRPFDYLARARSSPICPVWCAGASATRGSSSKPALQRLTTTKKDAAGRSCPGFNPLAQSDATLCKNLMAGEHCLHGFTNRDIRTRPASTQLLRSCTSDPKEASAKVGRRFRRLHAHGLIARIPRTRRWRVTDCGRKVMGTTMYLREHHFTNVYAGVMH